MSKTILVVDDEKDIRTSLTGILEDEGYAVVTADSGLLAMESVQLELPDLVLLDIWMPGMDGLETLEKLKLIFPQIVVIMISGHGTIETAVRATKLGAFDFIEKPLSLDKVLICVANALRMKDLRVENEEFKRLAARDYEMIGNTGLMADLREQLIRVAITATPLLITGESGVGKELVSRAIHYNSQRRDKPFISVNCAAIPEGLIESELFGHEKGAFAGATSQKKGKIDLADGGTLFLNEIGDLSLMTQSKIVRLIQDGCFERFGGSRIVTVDLRVVASTTKNVEDELSQGNFSEALYSRLNVVPFRVPPLRERKGDIPILVQHLVDRFCRAEGGEPKLFQPEALDLLMRYDWPGNVRELKNIVERVLIMTSGKSVTLDDMPGLGLVDASSADLPYKNDENSSIGTLRGAREGFERDFIIQKLEENDWNISRTAEAIDLERSNLHRKIKSYGIDIKK